MPHAFVTLSSEVLPEFREFERLSTTVSSTPMPGRAWRATSPGSSGAWWRQAVQAPPYIFHSNGGLMSVATASRFPVRTCRFRPCRRGYRRRGDRPGRWLPDLVTFDVGGTSTDVSLVEDGRPAFAAERMVAGYPCGCRWSTSRSSAPAEAASPRSTTPAP